MVYITGIRVLRAQRSLAAADLELIWQTPAETPEENRTVFWSLQMQTTTVPSRFAPEFSFTNIFESKQEPTGAVPSLFSLKRTSGSRSKSQRALSRRFFHRIQLHDHLGVETRANGHRPVAFLSRGKTTYRFAASITGISLIFVSSLRGYMDLEFTFINTIFEASPIV